MSIKVGINGMGRIGRMVIRSIIESKNKNIKIKHINNRSNSEIGRNLIKNDSIHGRFDADLNFDGEINILDIVEIVNIILDDSLRINDKTNPHNFNSFDESIIQNIKDWIRSVEWNSLKALWFIFFYY